MTIRPIDTVQKLLLSAPTTFVGEYEAQDFRLSHAWPGYANGNTHGRFVDSPLSRDFIVLAFKTQPLTPAAGVVIPNYEPTGEYVAALMAVLFGKRFDTHGALEMTGHFYVPDLSSTSEPCEPHIPFHGKRLRADFPAELNLSELRRLAPLLETEPKEASLFNAFHTASLFYARALRSAVSNPEVAYLHLITAGERLSEVVPFDRMANLDAATRNAFHRIEEEMQGGDKIASLFRGRLLQLKRRYCNMICQSVDDNFFARSEADDVWGAIKKENVVKLAGAAYDLRSRYVHAGSSFGSWIKPRRGNEEKQTGKPYLPNDRSMATILHHAPTLVGLERLTRVALLKTAEKLGVELPPQSSSDTDQVEPSRSC
ncbi:HEPN domain-containing protein [Sphingomonas arenae]|uniref:HEPN domain-containing protein n=1 Tax=Sphingomonas arenae TaxID=2812555 RepID=UPI00196842AD|nr:HEPN domain-containing protein [Sphingomonas arenae]